MNAFFLFNLYLSLGAFESWKWLAEFGGKKPGIVVFQPEARCSLSISSSHPDHMTCLVHLTLTLNTQTQNSFKKLKQKTLFIGTKHNMPIFGIIPPIKLKPKTKTILKQRLKMTCRTEAYLLLVHLFCFRVECLKEGRLFQVLHTKTTQLNQEQLSVAVLHLIFHRLTVP